MFAKNIGVSNKGKYKNKDVMARKIYWILLIITVISGIIFYLMKEYVVSNILLGVLFFLSMLLVSSVHGIIAHSLNPELKGGLIAYPLLMGILFAFLFFICVFFVIPLFCPDFLNGIYK
jgi:hypothetical protein